MNIAYIDAANLHRAVRSKNWYLDYKKFRVWLTDKFKIEQANIFIGFIPLYADLYRTLESAGFVLNFKEVIYTSSHEAKGNCDAEFIVRAMEDMYEGLLEKALLVSSDGDFAALARKLEENNRLIGIMSPASPQHCSILLKRLNVRMWYLDDYRSRLELIK